MRQTWSSEGRVGNGIVDSSVMRTDYSKLVDHVSI